MEPIAGEGNAAGMRGHGFGFEYLWLETMLPSLTFHSPLRISQDMRALFLLHYS